MTLPRYAIVLNENIGEQGNEKEVLQQTQHDDAIFFQALSQFDARDPNILHDFMEAHRNVRIKVLGLSECVRFHENSEDSPDFEQFSVDLWKEFYIQEDIIQIGVLEDKEPTEGLFVGATSGRVYVCGQADDFSQQKCVCVAQSLFQLIWKGPEQPVQYKAACMMDGCYGCFDPVMRHRLFRHKQF